MIAQNNLNAVGQIVTVDVTMTAPEARELCDFFDMWGSMRGAGFDEGSAVAELHKALVEWRGR